MNRFKTMEWFATGCLVQKNAFFHLFLLPSGVVFLVLDYFGLNVTVYLFGKITACTLDGLVERRVKAC